MLTTKADNAPVEAVGLEIIAIDERKQPYDALGDDSDEGLSDVERKHIVKHSLRGVSRFSPLATPVKTVNFVEAGH